MFPLALAPSYDVRWYAWEIDLMADQEKKRHRKRQVTPCPRLACAQASLLAVAPTSIYHVIGHLYELPKEQERQTDTR